MITRRLFLRNTASAGAVAATIAAPAIADAAVEMPAKERFDHHLAELKKAAEDLDPRIGSWLVKHSPGDDLGCGLLISAFRVTGRYEGDGQYDASTSGRHIIYTVELLPDRVDGERMFSVRTPMERMTMPEPRFRTFIGRRVS